MADDPIAEVAARVLGRESPWDIDAVRLAREVERSNEAEERYLRRGLELAAEVARLNSAAGVGAAFYRLTVLQRDAAWREVEKLEVENRSLRALERHAYSERDRLRDALERFARQVSEWETKYEYEPDIYPAWTDLDAIADAALAAAREGQS